MKITDLSILCKWENLKNRQCIKYLFAPCTQYLVGAPFALITASIRRGMEVISLWHR